MNPSISIGGMEIGTGRPWIIVPIAGKESDEIVKKAAEIAANPYAEFAEWRADCFAEVQNAGKVRDTLRQIKEKLAPKKLIFSFRNIGGDTERVKAITCDAVLSGFADIVDVDLDVFSEDSFASFLQQAHDNGCLVMGSYHNFQCTPDEDELLERMLQIQNAGADIVKAAVMPKNQNDVLTLLRVTNRMSHEHATRPIITISMSPLGSISRIIGEFFGSSMSYGNLGHVTDKGQLPAETLNAALNIVHTYLS